MKRLGILFLSAWPVLLAQNEQFISGQAAREVIGQPTFTELGAGAPSAYQLGAAQGIAYANNMLFVVDSNLHGLVPPVNNRVLIYDNTSSFIYPPAAEVPQGGRCNLCVGTPSVGQASIVLGQPNFTSTASPYTTQSGFRNPTNVATNGTVLVVSDTDNNRVLLWKSIPTSNDQPADIVLGQSSFTTANIGLSASGMRGPQGVWVQGNRLFVADTQNSRVLIWNSIPTANNQPADVVLGEPNFSTAPSQTVSDLPPTASNLFDPVAVSSDGTHVFVTDLGHNRVLIWNSIPTQNGQPADVVVGQQNMTSELDNGSPINSTCVPNGSDASGNATYPNNCVPTICPSTGNDSAGNPFYPQRCGFVLELPRFALSDGQRLFISDSGNDRVLVYNSIPMTNGQSADLFLGQPDQYSDQVTTSTDTFRPDANILESAPSVTPTPYALAWDGTNLYVSDPYDFRVLVFTMGTPNISLTGITNGASLNTFAVGTVSLTLTGTSITAGDTVTITITSPGATSTTCPAAGVACYTYTVKSTDTLASIVVALANLINAAPDPNVIASANIVSGTLFVVNLVARQPGLAGNGIGYSATATSATSASGGVASETATAGGSALAGGAAAAELAPGTLVTIYGQNLADTTATATPDVNGNYPTNFQGVQMYFDGIRAPILYVSPGQINTQLPFDTEGSNGASAYVRTVHKDGTVTVTNAISVPVISGYGNPGIFAFPGTEPRVAMAYHTSGNAIAVVDVDGSATAGDVGTLQIGSNKYNYTVQATDTLQSVRDGLIALVNANPDEQVTASVAGEFARIILTAKVGGPAGNGITVTSSVSSGSTLTLTTLGNGSTCCANIAGSPITQDNPLVPGEVITIYATGIGPTTLADGLTPAGITGQVYPGPALNIPMSNVDNAQIGGTTANVVSAGLDVGNLPGIYKVVLQTQNSLPTNPFTQLYIAQNVFTSNIVTIPVVAQVPPSTSSSSARPARKVERGKRHTVR